MKLKITHLYPDLLNFYGDSGNIEALKHRLLWRGIDVEICKITADMRSIDLSDTDIIFLGGGGDREEKTVLHKLVENKEALIDYVNNDGVILAVCGGFDMLGNTVEYGSETVDGPGVLDIYTKTGTVRKTGDVVIKSSLYDGKIVGFENRVGKTQIGDILPLGEVMHGYGNNGEDKTEGAVYKNVIGTHLHGPLLPKNPKLCDYILEKTLRKKYMEFTKLTPLSSELEDKANEFIVKRYEGTAK